MKKRKKWIITLIVLLLVTLYIYNAIRVSNAFSVYGIQHFHEREKVNAGNLLFTVLETNILSWQQFEERYGELPQPDRDSIREGDGKFIIVKLHAENNGTERVSYPFFEGVYLQGTTWSMNYSLFWAKFAGIPETQVDLDAGKTGEYTLIYSLTSYEFAQHWEEILGQEMYLSFFQEPNKKMVLLAPE